VRRFRNTSRFGHCIMVKPLLVLWSCACSFHPLQEQRRRLPRLFAAASLKSVRIVLIAFPSRLEMGCITRRARPVPGGSFDARGK
jgi:hypothetical protein